MTPAQASVAQAEANALAARVRLSRSAAEAQERLRPAALIREATREVVEAKSLARRAAGDDQRRLAIGGGLVVVLVLALPLSRWRRRRAARARAARIRGD